MARAVKKQKDNPNAWYEDAYADKEHFTVQYELMFEKDLLKPGDLFKIKNNRSTFKFRCLVHNQKIDVTWIDCIDTMSQAWHSFPIESIKGPVRAKRSRRKKINV